MSDGILDLLDDGVVTRIRRAASTVGRFSTLTIGILVLCVGVLALVSGGSDVQEASDTAQLDEVRGQVTTSHDALADRWVQALDVGIDGDAERVRDDTQTARDQIAAGTGPDVVGDEPQGADTLVTFVPTLTQIDGTAYRYTAVASYAGASSDVSDDAADVGGRVVYWFETDETGQVTFTDARWVVLTE